MLLPVLVFLQFYHLLQSRKKNKNPLGKEKARLSQIFACFFFSFSFLSLWLHCCALTQEFQFHSAAFLLSSYRWEKVTVGYLLFVYLLFLIFFLLKMYYFSWKCRFTVSRKNKQKYFSSFASLPSCHSVWSRSFICFFHIGTGVQAL